MDQEKVFWRMLDVIEDFIVPETRLAVAHGHKIFGAAIVRRSDLSLVVAETNHEFWSPLCHGGVYTIKKFFELADHPDPKECIFLSKHEPVPCAFLPLRCQGFLRFIFFLGMNKQETLLTFPYDIQI